MIILDTNIISEPDKPAPDALVLEWLNRQRRPLYLTVPTIAELTFGGHRLFIRTGSTKFLERVRQILEVEFVGRILPFDLLSTDTYGLVRAKRERAGRQISQIDGMIAAICLVHGATLATRNVRDFDGLDLKLVNPFEAGA